MSTSNESSPNSVDAQASALGLQLHSSWSSPYRGLRGFFAEVGHRAIGLRFIVTAFIFFLLGGLEALAMRLQLARPEQTLIEPDLYNQIFTMHGSTMMFLFAVPILGGLGVYLVPLMIGSRNMAFPRLSAYAYYTYLIGGLLLYVSFFLNVGPDAGWFSYAPLSGPDYSPGSAPTSGRSSSRSPRSLRSPRPSTSSPPSSSTARLG